MSDDQWAILVVNGGVTSLLVVAGMAKVVSPGQLARALDEIFGHSSSAGTYTWLRGVAAIEVVAGLLLVVPAARPAASGVAGVLGLCFVIIGALGWSRGSATACGCFGARSDHPLGPLNVLLGTFLMSAPVVNWMMRAPENHARDFRMHALGASLGLLIFCLWINRALIRELTRPNDATREESS